MRHYIVTLTEVRKKFISLETLNQTLISIYQQVKGGDWAEPAFELDKLDRLHLHTILVSPNNISYKRISNEIRLKTGLNLHFKPFQFKDYSKVLAYIRKEKRAPEDLEKLSGIRYNNNGKV